MRSQEEGSNISSVIKNNIRKTWIPTKLRGSNIFFRIREQDTIWKKVNCENCENLSNLSSFDQIFENQVTVVHIP